MFDFSGSEIMVIGVVALVLIGPKDLPIAVRAITSVVKKMRRMAGEFQGHVDEMMRDADLGDVQSTFRDIRGMGLKGTINRVVDADGSLGRAFDDPFSHRAVPPVAPNSPAGMPVGPPMGSQAMQQIPPPPGPAPSFIPPTVSRMATAPVVVAPAAPAFVPPAETREADAAEDV